MGKAAFMGSWNRNPELEAHVGIIESNRFFQGCSEAAEVEI